LVVIDCGPEAAMEELKTVSQVNGQIQGINGWNSGSNAEKLPIALVAEANMSCE